MKYLFFTAAVLGIIPATVFMICDRKFIRWGVLGLILPLGIFNATAINFFSRETYRGTSRGLEVSLIYIVAASLLLAFFILRGQRKCFPDWGSKIYALYVLLCIPSALNAPDLQVYTFELWKMAMIHLVFMAVYYYLEFYDGDIDIIFYGVAIFVALNFVLIVRGYLVGVYRVSGTFPHPNSMAMYMEIAGLLFFSRAFNHPEGRKTLIYLAGFIMASFAIARTFSRGAIFCYPIGGVITLLCSLWGGRSPHKTRCLIFLVPLAVIGIGLLTPKIIERFEKAPTSSGNTRKQLALAAMNMINDKKWFGVGLNNWSILVSPPYHYTEHRDQSTFGNDENTIVETIYRDDFQGGIVETIYLLVGAECGIPCLLMLLCWFGYYWISSFRLLKLLRRTEYFYLPAGTFGALTTVFMQSALEWVLKQQINFIWLVTVFAIISFLNKHYQDLIDLEEKKRAEIGPADGEAAAAAGNPAAPPRRPLW